MAALVKSPHLWIAFVLSICCWHSWLKPNWWDDVLLVIPSLIGFSLAAYAMLLAFANDRFLRLVTTPIQSGQSVKKPSIYADTSAAFAHYILVQFVSLVTAIVFKAFYVPIPTWFESLLKAAHIRTEHFVTASQVLWFPAFWLFLYSISCGVAATMRIFLMTRWFGRVAQLPPPSGETERNPQPVTPPQSDKE